MKKILFIICCLGVLLGCEFKDPRYKTYYADATDVEKLNSISEEEKGN